MIITRIEAPEAGRSGQERDVETDNPGHNVSTKARFIWDVATVIALWVFILVLTHEETFTWLYTPDSEFYASLSAFGHEITDRAREDAYYWTKLGVIAPQHLLSDAFGFIAAHEIFRAALLLLVLISGYVVARVRASRLISSLAALLLGLNTVILGFLGDTYATGAALASLVMLFALCYLWPLANGWYRILISASIGIDAGWLMMIHPNFVLVSAVSCAVFMVGNVALRSRRRSFAGMLGQSAAVVVGFAVTLWAFTAVGNQMFPGMDWLATVIRWANLLNVSNYASTNWDWLWSEGSLLVPLVCLIICLGLWLLTQQPEIGLYAAVCGSAITVVAVSAVISGGPTLEASFFNSCLWPFSLMALIAALTATQVAQLPAKWLALILAVPTIGAWVTLGHWDRPQQMSTLLVVAITTVLVVLVLARTSLHLADQRSGLAVGVLVLVFAVAGSGAQLLQNGRPLTPIGVVMRQPYWNSFVQSQTEEVIRLNLGIESWVLNNTAPTDRVAVWVQPESYLVGPAGMSLWGPNAISQSYDLGEWGQASLKYLDPSVVVMYGSDMAGIERMIASLQTVAQVVRTTCRDFTDDGPHPVFGETGTTQTMACIVRVSTGS